MSQEEEEEEEEKGLVSAVLCMCLRSRNKRMYTVLRVCSVQVLLIMCGSKYEL